MGSVVSLFFTMAFTTGRWLRERFEILYVGNLVGYTEMTFFSGRIFFLNLYIFFCFFLVLVHEHWTWVHEIEGGLLLGINFMHGSRTVHEHRQERRSS